MVIKWNGTSIEGEDTGSEIGTQATRFVVFHDRIIVETEQSSSLDERDQIKSQLSAEPACDAKAQPPYSGNGDGLLEDNHLADYFAVWRNGIPRKNAYWGPNVGSFSTNLPNCDGGTIPVSYAPGTPLLGETPLLGDKCPADRRKSPSFDLYYGKHSQSGSLAKGVHDTWDFDCTFTPNDSWESTGVFTMTENPCPHITTGRDLGTLRPSTLEALRKLYKKLVAMGGCFQFRLGWTSSDTHAQNADIVVGFRPMGLDAFITTEQLRRYIVPVLHKVAAAAGLCGPTQDNPVRYQTPYKKGKEKKPSCHFS